MLDKNLVDRFTVDRQTQKPDCIACTESNKQWNHSVNQLKGKLNLENLPILMDGENMVLRLLMGINIISYSLTTLKNSVPQNS
jgi:hypothetical protein